MRVILTAIPQIRRMSLKASFLFFGEQTACFQLSSHMRCYCKESPKWGSVRHTKSRTIKLLHLDGQNISPAIEVKLQPFRLQVKQQGDKIKQMKASNAPEADLKKEIQELKSRKKELEDVILELMPSQTFDKAKLDDVIKQSFIYDRSFSLYGGMSGQYDYGPVGCSILDNIISEWKKFFILHENMMRVNCSTLTPLSVLEASGHVEKFSDYMVKDTVTGELFRLDHLLKQSLQKLLNRSDQHTSDEIQEQLSTLDGMSIEELKKSLCRFNISSPSGNQLSDPIALNLMFPISLDPSGIRKGFLRPETSQGIFMNFKQLLDHNHGKLPFACGQVGPAFRNEINPQRGLLRLKEFTMGEIVHFSYPDDKTHSKFYKVSDTHLWLYSACDQVDGEPAKLLSIGEAVKQKVVSNEILGYYMARIQSFLVKIGVDADKLRFRQHLSTEMAHYACDCWDAECLTSFGWVECVGCADRGTYDLDRHSKATGARLVAQRLLSEPRTVDTKSVVSDKGLLKRRFKGDFHSVMMALNDLSQDAIENMERALQTSGEFVLQGGHVVTREMISKVVGERRQSLVEDVTPSVVEPSFGIDRIFYVIMEHSFRTREDEKRNFFSLPGVVAPFKVSILPLVHSREFDLIIQQLSDSLSDLEISFKVDEARGSIGRRYTRSDMIGIPLAITVDKDSLSDSPATVTLRDRDSTEQVRMRVDDVLQVILKLIQGKLSWESIVTSWPIFRTQDS